MSTADIQAGNELAIAMLNDPRTTERILFESEFRSLCNQTKADFGWFPIDWDAVHEYIPAHW